MAADISYYICLLNVKKQTNRMLQQILNKQKSAGLDIIADFNKDVVIAMIWKNHW